MEHVPGNLTAYIYFWDDLYGIKFRGWWISPRVGSANVWAFNEDHLAMTPPVDHWHVPWDGRVDVSILIQFHSALPSTSPA